MVLLSSDTSHTLLHEFCPTITAVVYQCCGVRTTVICFTHVSKVCIGAAVGSLLSVVQAVGIRGDRKISL